MKPPPRAAGAGRRRGWAFWSVLGAGLLVGLVNVSKPVHIDDTLYLNIARWIVRHPLDPYGGSLNWQQVPERTYQVSISPPLLSYVLAGVIAVAGENILLLHAAMIPWVLLACWALYRLGERYGDHGMSAALLVVLGPAVLVGTNLMLDVPLLACLCGAVECVLRGVERHDMLWYVSAAVVGAAGVLIKFPALALVAVFVAIAIQRKSWGPLLAAAGPLGAFLEWQAASRWLYGSGQVQAGLSFLGQFRAGFLRQVVERTLTMCAILGWTFPIWVLVPPGLGRPGRIATGLAALVSTAAAALLLGPRSWERPAVGAAFLGGVGLGAMGLAASLAAGLPGTRPRGDAGHDDPRPLAWAWVVGTLAIVVPFGPFVAVRSFLPIQPPLLLLVLGRRPAPRRGAVLAAVGLSAVLGLSLAAADRHWAACYPATARRLAATWQKSGRPLYFLGHWGWQYYAERAGMRPWDARWRDVPAGAVVIVPLRADRQWMHPAVFRRLVLREQIDIPPAPLGLTIWNRNAGIRFYGGDYGELPWGVSFEPSEQFFISEAGPPVPAFPREPALVR